MTAKPTPPMTPWTRPFWEATREGRLIIQRCTTCGRHVFYPRRLCPFCFADTLDWVEASGRGEVYSFTVVQSNAPSAFLSDMPFVIAIVELEEGVRMMSNLVDCDPESVRCGMTVAVTFRPLTDTITLPLFRPTAG